MATTNSALKRKHGAINDERRISIITIHGVPTSVPFSLLSNALGLYISQAFCWSIRFVDGSVSSEFIEMYTYDNKLVGRLRLRPRRSPYSRTGFHAENTGKLEILDRGNSNQYYSSTVASVLNDLVAKQPMLVTGFDGTIIKARGLLFEADDDPFFTGGGTARPRAKVRTFSTPPYTNNNAATASRGVYKSTYVSMLAGAAGVDKVNAEYRRRGNQGNVSNAAPPKIMSQGKENSYVSLLATNGGDNSTKHKMSFHGTTLGKNGNDNSTRQKRSSNRSRAPKAPLENIVEDREHWQGRI